jgi:hypothetical protein
VWNLHRGAQLATRAVWLFAQVGFLIYCTGLSALLPGIERMTPYVLMLTLAGCTWAVGVATGPGAGPDRPLIRWGLRLAWLPFAASWLLSSGYTLLLQLPFLVGMGWLVSSHVRPDSAASRHLRLDAALYAVLLAPAWLLLGRPLALHGPVVVALLGLLVAWFFALFAVHRRASAAAQLEPDLRHPLWGDFAREQGWSTETRGDTWWSARGPRLQVVVQSDPVPTQTRFVLLLPELAGLVISRREPGAPGGLSLGDPVLDAHLQVKGDHELALATLTGHHAAWLQLVHGRGGVLRDGVLQLVLEGDDPRQWVYCPEGSPPDYGLQQLVSALQELEELATSADPAGDGAGAPASLYLAGGTSASASEPGPASGDPRGSALDRAPREAARSGRPRPVSEGR